MRKIIRFSVVASCCFGFGTLLLAHAAPQTAPAKSPLTRFGKFLIKNNNGPFVVKFDREKGTTATFSGNPEITSDRYDIAAPQIVLFGKKGAATNAKATGRVRIVIRNPEEAQDTRLTADSAEYVGASDGKNPFIYATGNVHVVTHTPDFEANGPLVTDTPKAVVELLPNGNYSIQFAAGINVTGTPVEKPAAPKRKP